MSRSGAVSGTLRLLAVATALSSCSEGGASSDEAVGPEGTSPEMVNVAPPPGNAGASGNETPQVEQPAPGSGGTQPAPNVGAGGQPASSPAANGGTPNAGGGPVAVPTGVQTPSSGGTTGMPVTPSGGTPSTPAAGGAGGSAPCTITVTNQSLSSVIPTVGIVEWSTDLPGVSEAKIEFGLDASYGSTAPVDLNEPNYRTLLLGMKAGGHSYHFRVVASAAGQECVGADNTLPATGEPPTSLPLLTFDPLPAEGLDGGYLVFETLKQTFGSGVDDSPVYIVDADGDFVWWYVDTGIIDVGRARQSYDGKQMWISAVNVLSQQARIIRVEMDGTEETDFTDEFAGLNHDFVVHEDGSMAYIAYGSNDCDDIKERAADGTVRTIINSGTAVGASSCHCNALQYDRNDDTIVFSELETSSIVKVTRTGEVVWVMSAQNQANATVTGLDWINQHGMHIIGENRLLFFNNSTGPNATAIEAELMLNGGTGTASKVWSYTSNLTVQILGDVQRLPNGNTFVTFSTAGEIREVDPAGNVLQTIKSVGAGNLFGFSEKRHSLYGPPPR